MDRHLFKEKPVAEHVDFFFVESNDQSADDIRDKSSSIRVFFSALDKLGIRLCTNLRASV